jgi:hypothetical protein
MRVHMKCTEARCCADCGRRGRLTGCIFRAAQDRASKDVSLWVESNYLHKRLCLGMRQNWRSRRRRSNLLHSMAAKGCARGKLETG